MEKIQLFCHLFSPNIENSLPNGKPGIETWTHCKTNIYLVHYNLKPQKPWGLNRFIFLPKKLIKSNLNSACLFHLIMWLRVQKKNNNIFSISWWNVIFLSKFGSVSNILSFAVSMFWIVSKSSMILPGSFLLGYHHPFYPSIFAHLQQ